MKAAPKTNVMSSLAPKPSANPVLGKMVKGANAACGPKMPGLKGSGTPVMPMPKTSGFLDTMKQIALTDVGGPKGFLQPAGTAVANMGKKMAPKPKSTTTKRTSSGAFDVSHMARQMGV